MNLAPIEKTIVECANSTLFKDAERIEQKKAILASFIQSGCDVTILIDDVDDLLFNVIASNVMEFFPRITIADFTKAFQMNAMQQLPEHTDSFGKFNPVFVGKVLKSYMAIRSLAHSKQNKIASANTPLLEAPASEITEQHWLEIIELDKAHLNAGRNAWRISAPFMFDWLYKTARLSDNDLTDEEWRAVKLTAKRNVMFERKLNKGLVDRMSNLERDQYNIACIQEGKRIVYEKYLLR